MFCSAKVFDFILISTEAIECLPFQVLDGNILMLVLPSSGEHTFYKVKDANSIVMTDSVGNEPEGETAKHYVLKKEK